MYKKFSVILSSVLALSATPALADPIKIESDNIVFYGDAPPKTAKLIVEKMEIYRKIIMTLAGVDTAPDEKKLSIYAFDRASDVQSFAGMRGVAGVYTSGYDGPLLITPLRGALRQDSFNNQVSLHEYSHHILHGYMKTAYPRWYDEGFANYLSTFHMEDGTIQIGRAAAKHAQTLMGRGAEWVDVEDVVGAIRVYPFADRGSKRGFLMNQFYAQSWLYVHYLHSNRELSSRFGDYLNRINVGEEPLEAFENGFGVSPEAFHEAAQEYWYDNKFKVQQFQPKGDFLEIPMKIERISEAELDLQMALGQRAFLGEDNLKSYIKRLNSYEKKEEQTAQTLAAYVPYFINLKDYDQAETYALFALSKAPESVETLRMAGDAYFHKSHDKEFEELEDTDPRIYTMNEDMTKAIDYFKRTLDKSDEDYNAVIHMVSAYGSSDFPITSDARKAALTYEALYWDANDVKGSLDLANILMKSGDTDEACDYFATARQQVNTDPAKDKNYLANHVEDMMSTFGAKCGLN